MWFIEAMKATPMPVCMCEFVTICDHWCISGEAVGGGSGDRRVEHLPRLFGPGWDLPGNPSGPEAASEKSQACPHQAPRLLCPRDTRHTGS